eukprot:753536-Hanusia_phi.AAC.3
MQVACKKRRQGAQVSFHLQPSSDALCSFSNVGDVGAAIRSDVVSVPPCHGARKGHESRGRFNTPHNTSVMTLLHDMAGDRHISSSRIIMIAHINAHPTRCDQA